MTDRQKEIFQKMLEGKIKPWLETAKPVFYVPTEGGYFYLIPPASKEWDDYNKAWEAYNKVPLIKAME